MTSAPPSAEDRFDFDPTTGHIHSPPQRVFLEVTGRCNLACVHCPKDFGSSDTANEQHMSLELVERLAPWLRTARAINLNGVGEPMLAPQFDAILERACKGAAEVAFNTNGTLLTEAKAERLVELRVSSVSFSLDGLAFHQRVRGVPIEFVLSRIEYLERAKQRAGSELPYIGIAFTLMRDNAQELAPLLEQVLGKIKVHSVHVQPAILFWETLRDQDAYANPQIEHHLEQARLASHRHGVPLRVFRSTFAADERYDPQPLPALGHYSEAVGCLDPFGVATVCANGDLLGCSYGRDIGVNLLRDDPEQAWNCTAMRDLRRQLAAGQFLGKCKGCPCIFGSATSQAGPLRTGVHHSQARRFWGEQSLPA